MPKQKDLKRRVRERMQKTGESYTTARSQIIRHKKPAAVVPPSQYAELAGMSDEAVKARTGKTWKQWVAALDAVDAWRMSHRDIARHITDTCDVVSGWWSQMVTVAYERIRGLRDVGQRRGGTYDANRSRTFPVSVRRLYRAVADVRNRRHWLPEADTIAVRTAQPEKSMRLTWPDGTSVHLYFVMKGPEKCSLNVQHAGLASREAVEATKSLWAHRFDELSRFLSRR